MREWPPGPVNILSHLPGPLQRCAWLYFDFKSKEDKNNPTSAEPDTQSTPSIPAPQILFQEGAGREDRECSTFVPGHYSCIDTEGLLEADGEGCATGYQETDIGRHLRGS